MHFRLWSAWPFYWGKQRNRIRRLDDLEDWRDGIRTGDPVCRGCGNLHIRGLCGEADPSHRIQEVFPYLSRIEKSLKEQRFSVKRADREDLKCILAVYYEQNVTTERFEDFDGERWIIPED